jgi:hypothetical protein
MEVFLSNRKGTVNARGIYNEKDGSLTVCKGSIISTDIAAGTFRSAETVRRLRNNVSIVKGNKVVNDTEFKSPSSAANFVTGTSTNGLQAWKNKDKVSLKKMIEKSE